MTLFFGAMWVAVAAFAVAVISIPDFAQALVEYTFWMSIPGLELERSFKLDCRTGAGCEWLVALAFAPPLIAPILLCLAGMAVTGVRETRRRWRDVLALWLGACAVYLYAVARWKFHLE